MSNEIYFSLDVEADGPIPGPHSMLSFGLAAFTLDGGGRLLDTFGAHLDLLPGASPDAETMAWWLKQGDAYAKTRTNLLDIHDAMNDASSWVKRVADEAGGKAVCVAFPAAYDFMWWHWYSHRYTGADVFGFQAFDCKTAASVALGLPFKKSTKANFPRSWWPDDPSLKHDHDDVNDAVEQGFMFCGLMNSMRKT